MEFKKLIYEVRDGVAWVTLNRPEAANAVDNVIGQELMHAALLCDEDPNVRAVVLTGAGKIFCAGGDLKAFQLAGDELPRFIKETTTYLHAAISRWNRMQAPIIAAVNGGAGGAGLSLLCACDLAVASDKARFTMAYTRVGLAPDGSSTYFLARQVGLRRAMELTLTNRALSAQEALDWGLVNRIVPEDVVLKEAAELAAELASGARVAQSLAKQLIYRGLDESLETQMELESRAISDAGRTADSREGIAAFLEKRPAKFER